MAKSLIIVESPAKTRTIGRFVGEEYQLEASMGHVRDLPKSSLGIDLEDNFRPKYLNLRERASTLKKIQSAVSTAKAIYLATDPDREGEAIAWHLAEALKLKNPRRIEFNEITRTAVTKALKSPRPIDMKRVNAQQARRLLDRLVGYTLSPLLQRKMKKRWLSAGRVQSVAVRLICDREREIQVFVPEEFWDITVQVTPGEVAQAFQIKLLKENGKHVKIEHEERARQVSAEIWETSLLVTRVKHSEQRRRPQAPFTTSTLQQDAANRLGISARQTMRVAQQLYEGIELGEEGSVGLITYMRTDSTRVAAEAQTAAREVIAKLYDDRYLPKEPRQYAARRGAQEAHEAIRPTYPGRTPDEVAKYLDEAQNRLYRLIWSRFLASQMADQLLFVTIVDVTAGPYLLRGNGIKILFPGFSQVYPSREKEALLPKLTEGELLIPISLSAEQRFTTPPPRYTEATLVKALEAKGIGRPSTYAPIISTIQERGYVYLEEKKFYPTDLGFAVTDQLIAHFPDIIEVEFTAKVESELDQIEEGKAEWIETLREFYHPFKASLDKAETAMEKITITPKETGEKCELCGKPMVLRVGRQGPFLACSGYPDCKNTRPAPGSSEVKKPQKAPPEPTDQVCEKCGSPMVIRTGRRGKFLSCSAYPKCKNAKPLPGEESEQVTDVTCDKCGKPMALRRGRFGPFLGCTGYPECKGIKRLPKEKTRSGENQGNG